MTTLPVRLTVQMCIRDRPIHRQTQAYRLVDAATGEFEHGLVKVADMVTRQPWADDVPVEVLSDEVHLPLAGDTPA